MDESSTGQDIEGIQARLRNLQAQLTEAQGRLAKEVEANRHARARDSDRPAWDDDGGAAA